MEALCVSTTYGTMRVYQKAGGSRQVLLLHGAGADSALLSWREVLAAFGEEYTVYAPDLLGYGQSDAPTDFCGARFYQKHIDSVLQLADALGLTRFALAGLSMGGAIALGFALAHPQRVAVLLPVDSWGVSAKLPMHRLCWWYIHKTDWTLAQYRWMAKHKWMARWAIAYSLMGDKALITDALTEEVMAACRGDEAGRSMLEFQRSSCTRTGAVPFYLPELHRLAMPVTFVNGEKDSLVPVRDARTAAAAVPDGQCAVLSGCRHWSVKERPQEFVGIVENAMRANAPHP